MAITFNGTPISIGDLAIQPGTDLIYGIHSNADATNFPGGLVFTIDPSTGTATLVGDSGQGSTAGLAFAPDGTFYSLDFGVLHTLDPNTAAILTSTQLNFGGHDGLAIRPSDGALFATRNGAGTAGDEIRLIDPIAATSTLVGETGAGNASDLAFRVVAPEPAVDEDEYLIDLTGRAGHHVDVVMSADDFSETGGVAGATQENDLAILVSESDPTSAPVTQLQATGVFDTVTVINVHDSTPTLADLAGYESILAYTNSTPNNPAAVGDLLADYVDAGGHLVMGTYGFSSPWAFQGQITENGYSPFENVGVNGDVSGNLVAAVPNDPIFAGIDLNAVSYFHNGNFAHPGLDAGATLLATDGAGTDMIARNADGNIVAVNLYPRGTSPENNQEMYDLIANALRLPSEPAENGTVTLELLDTDGTTVLATGTADADNYDLGIQDFVVPADGVYTVRVTGQSGRYAIAVTDDLVFDTEPNDSLDSSFNASLTQGDVFTPNVLTFDFNNATAPAGDGTLAITAFADLDASFEYLTLDAEGLFTQQVFVTGGLQEQTVSTSVTIPQAILAQLASDGTVSFTITPSSSVNNLEPPDSTVMLNLTYSSASTLRSLDPVSGALGYLGTGTDTGGVVSGLTNSFESLSFPTNSTFIPPDPIIAAGPQSVVTMVNTDIAIHDKQTGAVLATANLFGTGGFWNTNNVVFDPWIVFDPDSGRYIAMGVDEAGGSSRVYLAISTDSTPTNLTTDWYKYSIVRAGTNPVTGETTFSDYPKLGVNRDAVFLTSNQFGVSTDTFSHVSLFAIAKAPLLSGGPVNIVYDENITGAFSIHPLVDFDGGSSMYFAQTNTGSGNTIILHRIDNVLTGGTRTTSVISVPTYAFPQDVPQLGGPPIDTVDARVMSGVVRDGSLWTAHAIVDPAVDSETVVRWYQIDISGATPTLVQSGDVDPGPGIHTWMPHINVDNDGDMGIAFSMSGPNQYAGIGYTGRLASDPQGTTRPVQTARAGEASYSLFDGSGRNRWGDYSGLAIDPDGETFWLYNEYAASGNAWGTFVGAFQVEPVNSISDRDAYSITLTAGDTVGFETSTPFDGQPDGMNLLDPKIEVYDPAGHRVAMDSNSADGKNAFVAVTPAVSGVYRVVVSGETNGTGDYVLSTFNINDAPVINSASVDKAIIDENDSVTLTVDFSDPDPGDTQTIAVEWADGSSSTLDVTSPGSYSFTHQYLDDGASPGNGTASDVYHPSVTVTDAAGESDSTGSAVQNVITNGDFETGDFTGWSISTTGSANWQINDGSLDPPGPAAPLAPISGNFDAVSTQSGSSLAMLSDVFVVPDNVTSAVLSWSDRIQNFASQGFVDPGQEWRVLVFGVTGNPIQEVFSTNPGDPDLQLGPNHRSFDLTSLFQSLAGRSIQLSFEQQSQFYFMNASLDDVSLEITTDLSVTVNNVAPSLTGLALDQTSIDENGTVTLTGTFDDPGTLDVHTVDVDWADGTVETYVLPTGDRSFSFSHQYLDDGPSPGNATSNDDYTINVTIQDDDGGMVSTGSSQVATAVMDFEALAHDGTSLVALNSISEDGFTVRFPSNSFAKFQIFGTSDEFYAGSAAIATYSEVQTVELTKDDGGAFDLVSLDLSEYRPGPSFAPATVTFTGVRADNSTVTQTVVSDGVFGFETVPFTGFTDLVKVTWLSSELASAPSFYQIDNITLQTGTAQVPGPVVTVNNVAPSITSYGDPAPPSSLGVEGQPVTLSLDFSDPGALDVHTVDINWGDGNIQSIVLATGDRSLTIDHTYAAGGIFSIDVTVSDDDLGSDSFGTTAFITGVGIQNVDGENVLYIIGTAGDDDVSVNQQGNGMIRVHAGFIDDHGGRVFNLADVDRIVGYLSDGDDQMSIAGNITLPTLIDAGAGNDHVNGGGGSDVIFGRDGDDDLGGGGGLDILIGGRGQDRLVGGPDNDLLFAGIFSSTFDSDGNPLESFVNDEAALLAIQLIWNDENRSVSDRIGDIESLDDFFEKLVDDEIDEQLTGASGADWFLLFDGDRATDAKGKKSLDVVSDLV